MGTITYYNDIPDAPNNPSNDQTKMRNNTNSVDFIIDVDHYSFESSSNTDGLHKQVSMPVLGAIPAGRIASEGTLYAKTSGQSQLFYTNDASTNEYQMTRVIDASFSTFANQTGTGSSGWTFLPGGMLMQWGQVLALNPASPVGFPITFSTACFSVVIGPVGSGSTITLGAISTSNFAYTAAGSLSKSFNWIAIGK